jgi:hypothetical protein
VSFGNSRFPSVVIVLSGDNVTIELTGETLIRKGVTSATFRGLPDVPFENIEVSLPAGEYSEFGAVLPSNRNYNFCGEKLVVPMVLGSQNGLQVKKNVPLSVTGCPRPKRSKHSHAKASNKKKRR